MKSLFKYLLLLITVAVIGDGTESLAFALKEDSLFDWDVSEAACQINISESDSEDCIPRKMNLSDTRRTNKNTRRVNHTAKSNALFIKSGKHKNATPTYISQSKTITSSCGFVNPAGRLFQFGRLII